MTDREMLEMIYDQVEPRTPFGHVPTEDRYIAYYEMGVDIFDQIGEHLYKPATPEPAPATQEEA